MATAAARVRLVVLAAVSTSTRRPCRTRRRCMHAPTRSDEGTLKQGIMAVAATVSRHVTVMQQPR